MGTPEARTTDEQAPRIRVQASEDSTKVYLYDAIGWYGVTAKDFADAVAGVTTPNMTIMINSPGGDVFEARAIVAAIRGFQGNVTAHITGVAASAATFIAMAAKEVVMEEGAFFMIHNAWGFTIGNARDHRYNAELLDKVDGSIITDYAKKTGQAEDTLQKWMDEETWFDANEAKSYGFVDKVLGGSEESAAPDNRWHNLMGYRNIPAALKRSENPPAPSNLGREQNPAAEDTSAEDNERHLAMLELIGR